LPKPPLIWSGGYNGRSTIAQRSSIITKRNRTNREILGRANPGSVRERPRIERKFAEQKRYHGLRQACYWGLAKVTIQALLTCLVVNCKRMAKRMDANCGPPRAGLRLANGTSR
jgi:IS5 family transposase